MRRTLAVLSWMPVLAAPFGAAWHFTVDSRNDGAPFLAGMALLTVAGVLSIAVYRTTLPAVVAALATGGLASWSHRVDHEAAELPSGSLASEWLLLIALVLLAGALVLLVRQRLGSGTTGALVDGVIVGLGAWLVVWVVLVEPALDISTDQVLTAVRAVTLGAAIAVLFLAATVIFSDQAATWSVRFLGTATAALLVHVFGRAVEFRSGSTAVRHDLLVDAPMAVMFAAGAAMLLHPSIVHLGSTGRSRQSQPIVVRILATTAALVAPVIVLASIDPLRPRDRAVRTISVIILAVAVMARVVQAVRANARSQADLLRIALTDPLTGLPNRTLMIRHIDESLRDARPGRRQPTVLFIDVDRFKNINDSLGHATGDVVLGEVARRIVDAAGPGTTVGRISGDEFVVLDPGTETPTRSVELADRILDAFRDPVATASGDMFVTASIGVAFARRGVRLDAEDLMRHADTAMYRAKDAGRNCIALFDDSMIETVTRRLDLETALHRALERDELRLVHQPILDLDRGRVVGFEALMRWDRGEEGVVSPADFIPVAEETGTIVPLGSWAVRDALGHLREWIDRGQCAPDATMSVNVSARQLHDPRFVGIVGDALAAAGLPAGHLWLEVTESAVITEPEITLASLRSLNQLGVRIAIDDFGTGYSSLSLLQQLPIQCIKIDRAFVARLGDGGSDSLVRTIRALANAIGADVIAEGVETEDQMNRLLALDCHRAQGFAIARPVPAAEVGAVVARLERIFG